MATSSTPSSCASSRAAASSPRTSSKRTSRSRATAACSTSFEQSIHPQLLQRLRAIARRLAPRPDADDALQQLLIDVWLRGSDWHEGRIVLHLKSLLRNLRRANASRAARERMYALLNAEDHLS